MTAPSPQHLHAAANLWSLEAVWPELIRAVHNAQNADGVDLGTVQAWRPGSGRLRGAHGDAVLEAVIRNGGSEGEPYWERAERTAQTVGWVAATVLAQVLPERVVNTVHPNPAGVLRMLDDLLAATPTLRPTSALNLALWIGAEDRAVRKLLREPADHAPLSGLRCPYCDTAGSLAMRSSARWLSDRPVICTAGCTCDGPGCPCGMSAGVEGLPHIWTQEQLASTLDKEPR